MFYGGCCQTLKMPKILSYMVLSIIFLTGKKMFFIWLHWVLVVACGSFVAACGISFPDQGSNLGHLDWEYGVLAAGPLGKSLTCRNLTIYIRAYKLSTQLR